jgi:hypothetical protein
MELSGGCLCGAVRYQLSEPPRLVLSCWCRVCQYIGAGSSTVSATFKASSISVTGELRQYRSTADSGQSVRRQFCANCGTHVLAHSETFPSLMFVRIGTLDDPGSVRPSVTMWTASAPSWAPIDPRLPMLDQQPPGRTSPAPEAR